MCEIALGRDLQSCQLFPDLHLCLDLFELCGLQPLALFLFLLQLLDGLELQAVISGRT